jgi:hypothetical protein
VLQRLLSKHFGALTKEASTRLHSATLEQLESWADWLLDATSLEAVFDDH